jgi:hypothetical protein
LDKLFRLKNFLHATNLSVGEPDLDPVRVKFRVGQQVLDDADGLFAGALILFEDDRDAQSGANIISVFSVHNLPKMILPHFSEKLREQIPKSGV